PYGGQAGLSSPTSIVNGIDVLANVSADAGYGAQVPVYIGFDTMEGGGINDVDHMYAEADAKKLSWLYWMFYLPTELATSHDTLVDDVHHWAQYGIAECQGTFNGAWTIYNVCNVTPKRNQPDPSDSICVPSWSQGTTVLTYMDA